MAFLLDKLAVCPTCTDDAHDMIDQIDLTRHAIFEASAGTGKTYTVGRLVLRLLRETGTRLDQILLVTFTEKATGELKDRLRRELEAELDRTPDPLLSQALDQYDQAPIFTIHGFCHWLLRHYAAELGQDFDFELVNDRQRIAEALRDVQQRSWHREFGKNLGDLLSAAGFRSKDAAGWEEKVLDLAMKYKPECDHRLVPEPGTTEGANVQTYLLAAMTIERVRQVLAEGKRQRGLLSFDDMIRRVAEGLDPDKNPRAEEIAAALRAQFRYAVVDEFQDTDPLQWRIFRRLFLDGGTSRLAIVGDPKQAIYGFRGADLPTYLAAARQMLSQWNAAEYPLTVNWRSDPALLNALNRLFGDGEFFPESCGMRYHAVQPPPPADRRAELTRDDSERPALTVIDVDALPGAAAARAEYAEAVGDEIVRLLDPAAGRPRLEFRVGQASRSLTASDICLLVFTRHDARDFMGALSRRNLAYSFYKKGGMRETQEARELRLVLRALARPDDESRFRRVLLTRFFRLTPEDLIAAGPLAAGHPARQLFRSWVSLAESGHWGCLFTSLLEDSGILFQDRDDVDYDRRLANLRMLMGKLQQAAYHDNLDLQELVAVAEQPALADPEDDQPPQETEEPRVRIMTIHAAKGLEFPVVFLAGGFTDRKKEGITTYRDEQDRLVFDLRLTWGKPHPSDKQLNARRERGRKERQEEQRRLLYVALTRAQFKLYVPLMGPKKSAKDAPVPALLAPALHKSKLTGGALRRDGEPPAVQVPPMPSLERAASQLPPPLACPEPLFPVVDSRIQYRRVLLQSFTRLQRQRKVQANAFGEEVAFGHDEAADPLPQANDPFHGAVFGELVHEVFERFEFGAVCAADSPEGLEAGPLAGILDQALPRFLPRLVSRGPLDQLAGVCRSLVRSIVWQTLRTPLRSLGTSLAEVPPDARLQELEFLFPAADLRELYGAGAEEWYCTGFMDLVFLHRGKVHLLDWKTNTLPSYGPDELARAMEDAGYHLQYQLYLRALIRWLRGVHGERFDYERHIGGVFYLFVRGMNGRDDSTGVYHVRPSEREVLSGRPRS